MASKPCDEDLIEVAEYLHGLHPDSEVYPAAKRVAYWLNASVRGDRAAARKAGVSVAYFRKYMKEDAR
jgi:hypothetical protein